MQSTLNVKLLLLLPGLLIIMQQLSAQTISRYVIPTNGGNYKDSNLQVSATFGETFINTLNNNNLIVTQGFQQPDSLVAITLHLTCFIEGYYLWNGEMQPALYNQGESNDPYVTDTVEIQILASTPPYQMVQSTQALLHTNGSMTCKLNPSLFGHAYYIALKHRNAVETWSAAPVQMSGNTAYNFSTAASKAFGDNQTDVSGNGTVYALYSGDILKDANVDLYDLTLVETDIRDFAFGYYSTDISGDGNVDLYDLVIPEINIANFIYSLHP